MPNFELKRNPSNQQRPLLVCPVHEMELVVLDMQLEPNAEVVPRKHIYMATYLSGKTFYFFLKTDGVGPAMKRWSGNLVLEGIRYFSAQKNLDVLIRVTNIYTNFVLFADVTHMYPGEYPFDDPGEY